MGLISKKILREVVKGDILKAYGYVEVFRKRPEKLAISSQHLSPEEKIPK